MAVTEEESSSSSTNSRSLLSTGVHYLAKCALRSSVVLQVLHGRIRSPSSYDVVFGKETSIELVAIGEDGVVQSICEQSVFGIIKDLAILPWNEKCSARNPQMLGKDLLLAVSDSGKLSFLAFCNEMDRFFPLTHIQLSEPGNSRHHIGRMLAVDSSGCYIAVSAHEERLALFSVSASRDIDMIDKRITYPPEPEDDLIPPVQFYANGTIWSMCFISKTANQLNMEHNPVLAVLVNRKGSSLNELLLLGWDVRENTVHILSHFMDAGSLAHTILAVPGSCGLALLLRIGDILLMDLSNGCNPVCVQRLALSSSFGGAEEQSCMEEPFKIQDGDDEGFIAARALLELQDYCMDINKEHYCGLKMAFWLQLWKWGMECY